MAYNSPFPIGYQPIAYQNPQYINPQPMAQSQNSAQGIVWVSGEAGAKSYLLAPNTTIPLWDSERETIYLKSTDASGMPSMKILDYVIRENEQTPNITVAEPQKVNFVTHEELEDFKDTITGMIDEIKQSRKTRRNHESSKHDANADAAKK